MMARLSSQSRYCQGTLIRATVACAWLAGFALSSGGCGDIQQANPDAAPSPQEPDASPTCNAALSCPPDSLCDTRSGQCVEVCSPGQSACGAVCVDTADNPNHCGGCGIDCSGNDQLCAEATCTEGKAFEIARAAAVIGSDRDGIRINDNVWPGWRFKVSADQQLFRVTHVGYYGSHTTGSLFAAIVALDGPDDQPDALDLTGDDVVETGVQSNSQGDVDADIVIRVETLLEPGWYAVIFGSNGFGASGGTGRARDGQASVEEHQPPFAINQAQNGFELQTVEARVFIRGFAF